MSPSTAQPGTAVRPPVVVILGHVDHGKTKLLDVIRQTNVVAGESGGITQHIGAYQADVAGKTITFLDTPGHEAFTAIRSRGANVADIAILVVAADESVKPQTREAIRIIQDTGIPFIVAINKIDKDGANGAKVRQDLAQENVLVEGWGGSVPVVEISAKEGRNISELLDMVLLVADLAELRQDTSSPATGVIIESQLDKRRGHIATALVQKGILRVGDYIVVGTVIGKIKSMEDFHGASIREALPSQPVAITGWSASPDIGQSFTSAETKDDAEDLAHAAINLTPLFDFFRAPFDPGQRTAEKKTLNVIFRSDVTSSLQAIEASVRTIRHDRVDFRILDYGIGNITEADVKTAAAKGAIILGFRVAIDPSAHKAAEREGIIIRTFDIIYELIEAFRATMADLLDPVIRKTVLGKIKVLALFKQEGRSHIIGGKITSGKAVRGALVQRRDGDTETFVGKLTQVQHNKEDVAEVREGLEAGLRLDISAAAAEIAVGDVLEVYEEEKIRESL